VMPDNQSILSMTEDGELIHLNTNPESPDIGQIMQTFAGDSDDYVDGFNVSPDQTIVVTSHLDRSTHNLRRTIVWDIETGAMLHSFTGDSAVSRVTFMPDSKSIWGLSNNNDLIQLDINPESPTIGQVMRTFAGHSDTITSFSISPDATEVLTGSMDTTLILRDIETGAMIRQFVGHTKPVAAVAFTPDGSRVVSGTYGEVVNSFLGSTESTVIVWDIASGEPLRVFEGIAGDIHQLAVSEDGKFILVNRTGLLCVMTLFRTLSTGRKSIAMCVT
jgi:WD40 repeat protein